MDKKPSNPGKFSGEKKFGGNSSFDKRPGAPRNQQGEKRSFGRSANGEEKKPYSGNGRPAGKFGEKRSFGRSANGEEKKPYSGNGRPAGKFGEKRFDRPNTAGPRRPAAPGNGKPFGRPAPKPAQPQVKPANDPALPSTNARRVALEIFQDVVRKDAFAALSLDDRMQNANLSQLDKRFCASIVYRTLENLIRIDYVLSFYLKDAEALEPKVRDILRISACQLLFHDRIPDNAIVDEAVKLTRALGIEGLTGLTNAVLRSMVREKEKVEWPKPEDGAKYLSIMYSVPLWLAERLINAYGENMAKEICAYRNQDHFTTIRPNMMRLSDTDLETLCEKKVWEVEKGAVPHAYRVRMASEIARDADYMNGSFAIQGESSMLAAQAVDVKMGMQVLDCCAAPGGKSAYLAETMAGTGRVYAWDLHEHRVTLIKAMMKRMRLDNIRPVVRDATVLKDELISSMDAVLLDAPCSGLGVMDNKPDIKYRATLESVQELTEIQEKLLNTCCQYVKRGGTLVYSTCSMLPEENTERVKKFLADHPEFQIAPLPASFDEKFKAQYTEYGLQLLPHRDGVEGFFIARMRRVK